ncbi:PLC-like phosphodiesterase [Xylariomycetidae sp. FL2044]|nr:PLC-like phosphodiesterase [Xylariomycetidae sp. FL2044]
MRKRTTNPPSNIRRRLTLRSEHGVHTLRALKRAIDLASFITPTVIHFPGEDIYLSAAIQRYLRRVYDDYRRGEPTLSRQNFTNFLEAVQGEASPCLTEEHYKFEKFLEVWWLHFGLDAEKPAPAQDKDLSKPISNYFISSSHNTYITGNQITGRSTADAYRRVLLRGCRCVEIDVWNGDSPSSSPERQPSASRSGHRSLGHARLHSGGSSLHSGGSLHSAAAQFKDALEQRIDKTRHKLGVQKVHSHSPKCSQSEFSRPPLARGSGSALHPDSAAERVDPPLRSRSSIPRDEPIVMHGYTFTSIVGFREVCKAIYEVAFEKTNLPIIISLEVHADQEQQETMVQIMKEEWGDSLVDAPHEDCPTDRVPRLEELLNKILVKVKKASPSCDGSAHASSLSPKLFSEDDGSCSDDDRLGVSVSKRPRVPICEKLSSLAIYTHSEKFANFDSPAARIPSHIFSISESKILDLLETKSQELVAHNRRFFMRAYPRGRRIDSSNLDPAPFWRKGIQMVAMNWQYWDEGMMLNEAMFSRENGWVLKPPGFLSEESPQGTLTPHRNLDLLITVLAGQHIPLPEGASSGGGKFFRPLVKCELHIEQEEERSGTYIDVAGKLREHECKQKTVAAKTDHPDFGATKNCFQFMGIQNVVEQLSFVRFKVEDDVPRLAAINRDPFSAWACIRLDRLATGYRFLHLLDVNGNETQGLLLVLVTKNYH